LWSGEEMGLLGSQSFVENPPVPMDKVEAYLNFDMVGNLKDNGLSMQGLGSSPEWRKILEKKNIMSGFNLAMSDDPYLPTDAMSFYKADVPVAAFFTGLTDDYHRPTDDANTLNYKGIERIGKFAAGITKELMKREGELPFEKVKMTAPKAARGFSVYLGTIPDYVASVEGVKISGTKPGGPAAKAGIKGNDILVSLADREVKNIYDYTNILSDLKPDETYNLEVMRDGKKVKLSIVPGKK
jgi:C-terminal processing protease CtpA/Prc